MTVETTSQQPQLTEREKEVARLITLDLTYQEIADQLSISIDTVYFHIGNMLVKLNARSRVGIAVWYLKN
jgi:DNA-binding CsgD family transcriptional regulator